MSTPFQTAQEFALEVISDAERSNGLSLSPVAKQLLSLPVEEASEKPGFDPGEAAASISRLVQEMTGPAFTRRADPGQPELRDAQAVIRAISLHFCDIPPFCDKTGR